MAAILGQEFIGFYISGAPVKTAQEFRILKLMIEKCLETRLATFLRFGGCVESVKLNTAGPNHCPSQSQPNYRIQEHYNLLWLRS